MKSLSFITIVLFGCLSSTLLAQDCNNPLLAFFGIEGLDSPQSLVNHPFCPSLLSKDSCCSKETIGTFQDRANRLVENLNNYAAGRDLYIAQLRNSYSRRFNDILQHVTDDRGDQLNQVRDVNGPFADELQADIDNYTEINNQAQDINNQFLAALQEYQAARTNCFNTALQIQSSAWCLACDPDYASQGVADDGSVTFSDGLCQLLQVSCRVFFEQGARFNPLIAAREAYWRLLAISGYLDGVANTDEVGDFVVDADPYNPLASQQQVTVPEQWIGGAEGIATPGRCQDLWSGNEQLRDLLTVGPAPGEVDNNEAELVLIEEEVVIEDNENPVIIVDGDTGDVAVVDQDARLLQDFLAGDEGVWNPDLAIPTLEFNLRDDPGDVVNASDYTDNDDDTDS